MKLVRHSPRARRDDNMIPLINIIFLMLIFFMVIGRITPKEPIAVNPPVSVQKTPAETRDRILFLGADGRLALDDRILSRETLRAQLGAWRTPASGVASGAPPPLTLKADAAVSACALRETLDLLEATGIARVRLLTQTADQH